MQAQLNKARNKARQDGQTIAHLQQKLHAERLKGKVTNLSSQDNEGARECEDFTLAMLDPEHHTPYRYPDAFTEPTSVYSALNNFSLPVVQDFDPSTTYYNVSEGEYWAEVHPELDDTITYLTYERGVREVMDVSISQNNNLFGFKPTTGNGSESFYPPASSLALRPGDSVNIILPFQSSEGVLQRPRRTASGWMYPASAGTKLSFFWTSASATGNSTGASTSDITITRISEFTPPASSTFVASGSGTAGVYEWSDGTTLDGLGIWGLTLSNTATNLDGVIVEITITGYMIQKEFFFRAEELADISSLRSDIEKYRINAQSALLTYMGNVLTMAGQSATLLYRGGIPSSYNQIWDYKTVSQHQHSYNGPLIDGTYAYWEPQDTNDMIFRSVFSDNIFKRPYILIAGILNDVDNAFDGVLRLRVATHLEFTSKSQIYESIPSAVRPDLITCRAMILRGVPNSMENGKHLAKLSKIAKGIGRASMAAGKFLWTHRAAFKSAGETLVPVIATLV